MGTINWGSVTRQELFAASAVAIDIDQGRGGLSGELGGDGESHKKYKHTIVSIFYNL